MLPISENLIIEFTALKEKILTNSTMTESHYDKVIEDIISTFKFTPNVSTVNNKVDCEALSGRWGKFGLATAEYCDTPPWDQ